jgi:hypothetical protein
VKFKSLIEFKNDYEKKGFIDKVSTRYYPLKKLNPKQIQRYYLQYIKKWDKKYGGNILDEEKEQSEDSKLSAFVRERDSGCRLLKILTADELAEWEKNNNGLGNILDAAHVFGKNAFPWMRYNDRNVVTLNRFSHSCLDKGKSPINGKAILDEQQKAWWIRIIGKEEWDYLKMHSSKREGN